MPRRKRIDEPISPPLVPATTPEGREQQLIGLAMDLVEKRLREGTASSAETVHFLKMGSSRNKLETAKLQHEDKLIEAKTKAVANMEDTRKLMNESLEAMKSYKGIASETGDDYDVE